MFDEQTISMFIERRDDIASWLEEDAPYVVAEQKHLDANTPERAYWHLGYQAALADIIEQTSAMTSQRKRGRSN